MDFTLNKEQKDIVRAAREFATKEFAEVAEEFDRNETFDLSLWRKACELGFVGSFIDGKYGGADYGCLEHCLITEEFSAVDPGIATAILSTTVGAELLNQFGSEGQKELVLPKLVAGEAILATAVTEPAGGLDLESASTSAVRDSEQWVIKGTKMFVKAGNVATYVLVFCLTDAGNPSRHNRHSLILVPTKSSGYEASELRGKLGLRASHSAKVIFSGVRVPLSNLVGVDGEGFKQVVEVSSRMGPSVAAMGVGIARAALAESINYTKKRHAFGRAIASFPVTQSKLAEMAIMIRAARNLYYEAAWSLDNGIADECLMAMARSYAVGVAVKCTDEALQMHGGYGYINEYKVERLYRDAKMVEVWEGNEGAEDFVIPRNLLGAKELQ